MKPSAGVTASGVVSILGSLLSILFGLAMILASVTLRSAPRLEGAVAPPFNPATVLVVEAAVLCGLGVFGIVSAIGLLRLKNWARVSFLVFGGVLCGFSIMGMIGTSAAVLLLPQVVPPEQQLPPNFFVILFAIFLLVWLAMAGISIWWLIYFTRPRVKAQFMSEAEVATPRRGPLSITIIAWLLVVGGSMVVLTFLASYPVLLFGIVFRGWMAKTILATFGAVSLLAGVGLLRWRAEAHSLALAFYGFGLLSTVASLILPGSAERMQSLMQEMVSQTPAPPTFTGSFVQFSMVLALILMCVPIWFLFTRRRAFLEACKAPPQISGSEV